MITLAKNYGEGPMSAAEIATIQDISQKYLESILAMLKTAGLVTVRRGNTGGYMLSREPEKITMLDVLLPLEDSLGIVHCTENSGECDRVDECITRKVWQELKEATDAVLGKKNLAELVKESKNGSGQSRLAG